MTGPHDLALTWPDGGETSVRASGDETVLDAAEAAGIALPFGCRTGVCGTCTAQLVEGTVEHCQPPRALSDRHRDDGYLLSCIARPRSDCRLTVGAGVRAALGSNPWR